MHCAGSTASSLALSAMPIDPQVVQAGIQIGLRLGGKIRKALGLSHKPSRPFSGTIDVAAQTVDICTHNPKFCAHHKRKAAARNETLTAYLRGETGAPTRRRLQYLVSEIDRVRDAMRLRPLTQIESVAWGQQTPASKTLGAYLGGPRRPRRALKRRRKAGKKKAARRSSRRTAAPRRRRARAGTRRQLVKGSAAAKAWGRKMRRLRRR